MNARRKLLQALLAATWPAPMLAQTTDERAITVALGDDAVRDASVEVGAPITFVGPNGKRLSLAPLKGAFSIAGKIENGIGRYVILLPNDYVIHSPPIAGRRGPKPGSFMVSEADLKAIWDRITPETRIYIF